MVGLLLAKLLRCANERSASRERCWYNPSLNGRLNIAFDKLPHDIVTVLAGKATGAHNCTKYGP